VHKFKKGGIAMSITSSTIQNFVNVIANEMACGVDSAVERWMVEIESALTDPDLTTLGRMNAAKDVLGRYKRLTGKTWLQKPGNLYTASELVEAAKAGVDPAA
jgi:hypothetical protein